MREFLIDLSAARDLAQLAEAFDAGFLKHVDGHWDGSNMNAFHDYLSWPADEQYRLVIRGWEACRALSDVHRAAVLEVFAANPHVDLVIE